MKYTANQSVRYLTTLNSNIANDEELDAITSQTVQDSSKFIREENSNEDLADIINNTKLKYNEGKWRFIEKRLVKGQEARRLGELGEYTDEQMKKIARNEHKEVQQWLSFICNLYDLINTIVDTPRRQLDDIIFTETDRRICIESTQLMSLLSKFQTACQKKKIESLLKQGTCFIPDATKVNPQILA